MATNSQTAPYRELTLPAVGLGIVLGALMTASFVYISLKLGFGLGGSTVAAILGFVVLRGVFRGGSIVENNINQTVASGLNIASSGVSFTLPALFLLAVTDPSIGEFSPWPFIMAAMAGGFMGVVLIIPLRKQMIEFERLRFPSGIAVASLLKSPGAGARQAKLLGAGFAVSATFTTLDQLHIVPHVIDFGAMVGIPAFFPIAIYLSFANFGAGLLSGKGGLPFVAGGIVAWWIISPVAMSLGWVPDTGLPGQEGWQVGVIYGSMLRPLGIGLLIGGALMGVVMSMPALRSALKGLSAAVQARGAGAQTGGPQELSSKVLVVGLAMALGLIFLAALLSSPDVGVAQAGLIAVVGGVWLALAGLVVAQATGMTDISPMSGMALIAVTLMFFLTGKNVVACMIVGVAVCVGIGQCADMMQDLKSGHLVGALPRKQQIAQFMVAWMGAPIAVGTVFLLWSTGPDGAGGFGPGTELVAPQAGALQAIIESLGKGDVALDKYLAGTGLGAALGLYPIGGLGVLVGLAMYLPFSITLGYGVGCVGNMALGHKFGARWVGSTVVPVAAGFIVGEALTSLTAALLTLASG